MNSHDLCKWNLLAARLHRHVVGVLLFTVTLALPAQAMKIILVNQRTTAFIADLTYGYTNGSGNPATSVFRVTIPLSNTIQIEIPSGTIQFTGVTVTGAAYNTAQFGNIPDPAGACYCFSVSTTGVTGTQFLGNHIMSETVGISSMSGRHSSYTYYDTGVNVKTSPSAYDSTAGYFVRDTVAVSANGGTLEVNTASGNHGSRRADPITGVFLFFTVGLAFGWLMTSPLEV